MHVNPSTFYPTATNDTIFAVLLSGWALVTMLIAYIIVVIPVWRVFQKAGVAGWKSIIPVYNVYLTYKIGWKPSMFFVNLVVGVVYGIVCGIGAVTQSIAVSSVMAFVGFVIALIMAVISLVSIYKFSRAFGHGVGFTLGLIFLNVIFWYILAFGSSQYQGPQD